MHAYKGLKKFMKYKFGKMFLVDLEHKMSVVSNCPELQEDYGGYCMG